MEKIHLLWVDDEEDFLTMAKTMFSKINSNVTISLATSGYNALDSLVKENYDVIISDYQMPGMNGLTFLQKLRSEDQQLPFIMFTGQGGEKIAMQALNFGADYYIMKSGELMKNFLEINNMIQKIITQRHLTHTLKHARIKYLELINTYQIIMDNLSEGVALESPEGNILYANQKMLEVFGYTIDEMYGIYWKRLIAPEDHDRIQKETDRRPKGIASSYKATAIRKSGEKFDILINASPIFSPVDKSYEGNLVIFIDLIFFNDLKNHLEKKQ
ncbi:MAG: response regulator [Candidatus Thorarchaeota archaeon]